MTRLTEEMIIAKTKQSNLATIKKMNCWGSELTDVSLLRRLSNIEVLSLSVNKISSLCDFQYCRNLQELFVRKNNITDLNQVCYLKNLPRLVNLWLDENPCTECDGYRLTVIKTIPNLKKLDNVPVDPEELEEALRTGRELIHPEEEVLSPDREAGMSRSMRPEEHNYYEAERQDPVSHSPEPAMNVLSNNQYYHRQYEPVTSPVKAETESPTSFPERRLTQPVLEKHDESNLSSSLDPQMNTKEDGGWPVAPQVDSSGSEGSPSGVIPPMPSLIPMPRSRTDDGGWPVAPQVDSSGSEGSPSGVIPPMPSLLPMPRSRTSDDDVSSSRAPYQPQSSQQYYQPQHDHQQQSFLGQYYERPRTAERQPRESTRNNLDHRCNIRTMNHQPPYHRRPTTRNSNILSAVLCLVKELDYPSLEVVEMAVRCRMDELED